MTNETQVPTWQERADQAYLAWISTRPLDVPTVSAVFAAGARWQAGELRPLLAKAERRIAQITSDENDDPALDHIRAALDALPEVPS